MLGSGHYSLRLKNPTLIFGQKRNRILKTIARYVVYYIRKLVAGSTESLEAPINHLSLYVLAR